MAAITKPSPQFELDSYRPLDSHTLTQRINAVREQFGPELLILGHHYQRDGVIELSDLRGDSYQLSKMAAESDECGAIVFCGVHFMAETADILANRPEKLAERGGRRVRVILPDRAAGCSMADMAAIDQVERAWQQLGRVIDTDDLIPVTYINSAASLKAFCGRHGGIVCTSSNAEQVLTWAFSRGSRVFFFPDQHLGRNTSLKMGFSREQMPVWDPYANDISGGRSCPDGKLPGASRPPVGRTRGGQNHPRPVYLGGVDEAAIAGSRVILWKGHCSVHQVFHAEHVRRFRERIPGINIVVHPECPQEVNDLADVSGSTGKIISTIQNAPAGSKWAIGTELHLVHRLKVEFPELEIHFLAPIICMCETMYRIDLAHLCWSLENLAAGTPVNTIRVDDETAKWSRVALEHMLAVS